MGQSITFDFELMHESRKAVLLKIGFLVNYVKANNKMSKKIFHITEKIFQPNEKYAFKKTLSFKDLSTRKHYPGLHEVSVTINGETISTKTFQVKP
jgi:hypothetical protein